MMKAVRRVIQSTVLKKEKKSIEKDGTVMAFFMSYETLTKSAQWINDIHICLKDAVKYHSFFSNFIIV
jgi:hypothetical protein